MAQPMDAKSTLSVNGTDYTIYKLDAISEGHVSQLPFSLKILLENLLRHAGDGDVSADDINALANWDANADPSQEISFTPSRVILQDFTGVPAVVDLAAMRDAVVRLGGNADSINPLSPAEMVIDHSVQVDNYGSANALDLNTKMEFKRNRERYSFLRWGQGAFDNFRVVPPNTGIVHQVNVEYLARVVFDAEKNGERLAYPDTVVGTDSHTTMVNGLGVLGWGVGGIEAEAAMLGQPVTMLIPQVIGFKLSGELSEGTTATDLVLTVTQMLREKGVVGKFVEFFGDGLSNLPLSDRATLSNMAPEFGSTCGIFPIDGETIRFLETSGRDAEQIALIEAYAKAQGMWREDGQADPVYTDVLELDMSIVVPSLAGPKRPQDRIPLTVAQDVYQQDRENAQERSVAVAGDNGSYELTDGAVAIAAITSCTNTSNPYVMIAAGLVARKAREKGLTTKPWVKTSLAPGSRVVTNYLTKPGLIEDLDALGFNVVGYGCTTCIGNSGPLRPEIETAIKDNDLIMTSVLSGNRNFEGRIHQYVKMNYLASPPLVVAYAIAGTMNFDLVEDSLGDDKNGNPVYLRDIWPSQAEVQELVLQNINREMFISSYEDVFAGDSNWNQIDSPTGQIYSWDDASTYVKNPPYFDGMTMDTAARSDIKGARALALLGDSVTTDHISPAGSITPDSPAGEYLQAQGVSPGDFNSYGSRRGNHEVMMRGTFANIRLRNLLAPGTEGGWTRMQPDGEQTSIYDAAMRYREAGTPLVVIGGKEYGTGSSRDWAAKGTTLLGVQAVLVQTFERIHRSNLVGMGVLPLQFNDGDSAESLGLTGSESFDIVGLADGSPTEVTMVATAEDGSKKEFQVRVRIDTPKEWDYYNNGGILHYVLRQLASATAAAA
ncbi:MAG: aconitate hydratase AcnA [Gammaproteobacteria bacterium]|nr:aconitate hydratase AcnA [Gammaproteobacteria bacterium]MCP4090446.1 aconitate hydratase AcnA [Gammaproteobacteria bacterium]MCP4275421.1 aconitate hydratase AcnA [Gammaproteobacteria bacterium]MCP4832877.1 aconitate hydratase AcnA [Gammaproteobacteria bacterium]MCP4928121.1 aconitate hydratase AcnA [Gammaproteobacteria bacterium]